MSTDTVAGADRAVRSYLWWSVAAAVLLFLPTGLVALYRSWQCETALKAGDTSAAAIASRQARRWLIITIIVGLLVEGLLLLLLLLLGAFGH